MKRTDSVAERLRRALSPTEQQLKDEQVALNSQTLLSLAGGPDMPATTREVLARLIRAGFGDENPVQGRNE